MEFWQIFFREEQLCSTFDESQETEERTLFEKPNRSWIERISIRNLRKVCICTNTWQNALKGTKSEKLHAMHVKELIKTNYSEW